VLIGMGPAGVPSRVLSARLGNRWTYAGEGVAPGQLPVAKMISDYRFRRIRPDAAIYGVTGKPVSHSRSPVMHNAGFAALGLNAVYVPLEASDAADLVRFARALSMRGVSITAPYKIDLMEHVDEVDPIARRVGAINTIVSREGKWIGSNTDVDGIVGPLRSRIELRGIRACVMGAGGAARGAAVALADSGALVTVSARRPEAARTITDLVGGAVAAFPPPPGTWDVLINATSGGGATNPIAGTPLDGRIVFDLVYDPIDTALLIEARGAGCQTINGLEMLIAQAERQFELWTWQRPPEGLVRAAAIGHEAEEAAAPAGHRPPSRI
jgi:3-dehydroquinate dehydratase/shikimate dehydrogenase